MDDDRSFSSVFNYRERRKAKAFDLARRWTWEFLCTLQRAHPNQHYSRAQNQPGLLQWRAICLHFGLSMDALVQQMDEALCQTFRLDRDGASPYPLRALYDPASVDVVVNYLRRQGNKKWTITASSRPPTAGILSAQDYIESIWKFRKAEGSMLPFRCAGR